MTVNSLLDKIEREAILEEIKNWRSIIDKLSILGVEVNDQIELSKLIISWAESKYRLQIAHNN